MIIRMFSLLLLSGVFSGYSYATCHNVGDMEYGSTIMVDLSDKLSESNPLWDGSYTTQYWGTFRCSTSSSKFGYTAILASKHPAIFGFNNGQNWVRAEIINSLKNTTLKGSGGHSAGELNGPFTVRFTLVKKPASGQGQLVSGNHIALQDVLFVTDLSGMSLLEILLWPAKQVVKILRWLTNGFHWPYDNSDMYGQPMVITYAPKMTTCNFNNAGLTVNLPDISVLQALNNKQAGYTPFSLRFSCQNMQLDTNTNRAITMFLSSNNLLATDATVLIDKNPSDPKVAKGVGLRLVKQDMPNSPVMLSTSNADRGNATTLFKVIAGGSLNSYFTINMGVYYYPYQPKSLTSGKISTSATLNIIYT